jgi:imidazolonepropionase-like amidohydrolase
MGAASLPQSLVFDVRSVARVATDMADLRSAGFLASARRPADSDRPIVSTVEEATQFVATRHSEGADYLKLQLNGVRSATRGERNLDLAMAKALVDGAHAKGMLAVAHIETLDDVAVALSAGVDGLAHAWRRDGASSPEIARRIAERGVFVSATLSIPDGNLDGRASLLADPRFQSVLSGALKEQLSRSVVSRVTGAMPDPDEMRASFAVALAAVRSLHEAGAQLLIGTDAANGQPAAHGISVHRELELFVRAGLSPTEALRAATFNAANAFRLTDRGRIATGRKADLVLVRGDPTSDVTATRDILRVWRDGVEFDRTLAP